MQAAVTAVLWETHTEEKTWPLSTGWKDMRVQLSGCFPGSRLICPFRSPGRRLHGSSNRPVLQAKKSRPAAEPHWLNALTEHFIFNENHEQETSQMISGMPWV